MLCTMSLDESASIKDAFIVTVKSCMQNQPIGCLLHFPKSYLPIMFMYDGISRLDEITSCLFDVVFRYACTGGG